MNFCPNCGAEKDVNTNICPYCGFSFNKSNKVEEYENKIAELEHKLAKIENLDKPKIFGTENSQMKYFWIMATIMIIAFFGFLFFFVFMARS